VSKESKYDINVDGGGAREIPGMDKSGHAADALHQRDVTDDNAGDVTDNDDFDVISAQLSSRHDVTAHTGFTLSPSSPSSAVVSSTSLRCDVKRPGDVIVTSSDDVTG